LHPHLPAAASGGCGTNAETPEPRSWPGSPTGKTASSICLRGLAIAAGHEAGRFGNPGIMDASATPSRDGGRGAAPPRLHVIVHAEPAAILIVRRSLREWLEALAWPEPDLDDVVIAVNEACTNAIEHAYPPENPGHVLIAGSLVHTGNQRHVTLVVQDQGRWRPEPVIPRYRGHGLTVMRGCMRTVDVARSVEGTGVTLTSFAVPPSDGTKPVVTTSTEA